MKNRFDVIVVGGGHAGVEAAAAAGRLGARVMLVTLAPETVGAMSCNPAFGGIGKSHLVREVDALDGLMGRAADFAGIHFKTLNSSRGTAVQAPRVQADRVLYGQAIREMLRENKAISFAYGECAQLLRSKQGILDGVELQSGDQYFARSVVLCTGTFLGGILHRGGESYPYGRLGEAAATMLSSQLKRLGMTIGRFKTGTPPRIDGRTLDFPRMERQWGDDNPGFLSFLTNSCHSKQTTCFITKTTEQTHKIVRENIHKSALFAGAITGQGPRYCPSLEDKVRRFAERPSHQIFLEPEGLNSPWIYPNGISMSLPTEVQLAVCNSIPGMTKAKIAQFGYAIEYDFVDPRELYPTLMSRRLDGLFFAGQINGTTGYEEAAAQGIVAGINAAQFSASMAPVEFSRASSYLGVLIDDLVNKGVSEPYRMFTSRSEYRLSLRVDNADERLTPLGNSIGVVKQGRMRVFRERQVQLEHGRNLLSDALFSESLVVGTERGSKRRTLSGLQLLSLHDVSIERLALLDRRLAAFDLGIRSKLESEAKYVNYIARQERERLRYSNYEGLAIPKNFDFDKLEGLSNELKDRFRKFRPTTVGQASRCEGATPAALLLLAVHARRNADNPARFT